MSYKLVTKPYNMYSTVNSQQTWWKMLYWDKSIQDLTGHSWLSS